mmetsp:Transcript_19854/g.40895  ORF Transcript_19854/g.40895 Transcript_19854/m.40895 type:complete len:306 (+) Transcript_19854:25-942(+)
MFLNNYFFFNSFTDSIRPPRQNESNRIKSNYGTVHSFEIKLFLCIKRRKSTQKIIRVGRPLKVAAAQFPSPAQHSHPSMEYFTVSALDLAHAAATVCFARVGLDAHDSFLDFLDESSRRVDNKGTKETINNDRDGQSACTNGGDGCIVNIESKGNQFKDDDCVEHADVELESSEQLEDVEQKRDHSSSNKKAHSGHTFVYSSNQLVVVNGIRDCYSSTNSYEHQNDTDNRETHADDGHNDDSTAVITAASAALGSLLFGRDGDGCCCRDSNDLGGFLFGHVDFLFLFLFVVRCLLFVEQKRVRFF